MASPDIDKRAINRAHRRMVRQTFSPGFTSMHRTRRGYQPSYPDKGWHDSHGWRGRKPKRRQAMPRVHRGILDACMWYDHFILPHIEADEERRAMIERMVS